MLNVVKHPTIKLRYKCHVKPFSRSKRDQGDEKFLPLNSIVMLLKACRRKDILERAINKCAIRKSVRHPEQPVTS